MNVVLQRQKEKTPNHSQPNPTGIPTQMKLDFEGRSGLSFDDVRVNYNSPKPAQFQALAYTQGSRVYLGPGQERHLKHELGHVVQQKLGIVRADGYARGVPVNKDPTLERQADLGIWPAPTQAPAGETGAAQFSKESAITRIRALANLSAQDDDQNLILYHALNARLGKKFLKAAGDDRKLFDCNAYLEELSEEELEGVEAEILGGISFDKAYKLKWRNCPRGFSSDFAAHHFAENYQKAWEISMARFTGGGVSRNTVMMGFQMDTFFNKEFRALESVAANTIYTTTAEYYFWQFKAGDMYGPAPAPTAKGHGKKSASGPVLKRECLMRGKIKLKASGRQKVYHLEGVEAERLVQAQGGAVGDSVDTQGAQKVLQEMEKQARILLSLVEMESKPWRATLETIAGFIRDTVDRAQDPKFAEEQVMCAAAQVFANLFKVIGAAAADMAAEKEKKKEEEEEETTEEELDTDEMGGYDAEDDERGQVRQWFDTSLEMLGEKISGLEQFYGILGCGASHWAMANALGLLAGLSEAQKYALLKDRRP